MITGVDLDTIEAGLRKEIEKRLDVYDAENEQRLHGR